MRIAILTWFHYHNYGTALQVVALSNILKQQGHIVDIINYRPTGKIIRQFSKEDFLSLYGKVINKFYRVYTNDSRELLFKDFYKKHLSFTEECKTFSDFRNLNNHYEAFICGSDQIWAPICFDRRYFLDFVENPERMVAYAPSVGLPEIRDIDIASEMKRLIGRFIWLSTREKSGSDLISRLVNKPVETVVDPTLLLNRDQWSVIAASATAGRPGEKYLIAYFLRNNKKYWEQVYSIAKRLNLSVKIIPVFQNDLRRNGCIKEPVGPLEFLRLIKGADFVCTDSFHGTAFAINFQKEFMVFERFNSGENNNQNSRIYNILSLTDLQKRLWECDHSLSFTVPINYSQVLPHIESAKEHSMKYLTTALRYVGNIQADSKRTNRIRLGNSICCGCAACKYACPVQAISLEEKNGFLTAVVNTEKCISCSKCVKVCPLYGDSLANKVSSSALYSYKDAEHDILKKSSSGGAAHRIAKLYLQKGFTVIGCMFDTKEQKARHIIIKPGELEKLPLLQGSKYLQSDFDEAMKEIKEGLSPLVVFGLPCQIAAARKIAAKDRSVIYVDLICHGVPSGLVYKKYLKYLHEKWNMCIDGMLFICRYKALGWRERYIYSQNSEKEYCAHQNKDPFFRIFESGFAYSESCFECRFRDSSPADIRLGDYWGPRFKRDRTGVSMIASMTQTGNEVLDELKEYGCLNKQDIKDYINWQQNNNTPMPVFYNRFIADLCDESIPIENIIKNYLSIFERIKRIKMLIAPFYFYLKGKLR